MLGHPNYQELLARVGRDAGTDRADVQASLFLEAYVWALVAPAVEALLIDGRLPSVLRKHVAIRFGTDGRAVDVTFARPSVSPSIERLRGELEHHLAPVIEQLAALSGRPRRALWRSAGDRLAGAFSWQGERLGMPEHACALGERAMRIAGPLQGAAGYRLVDGRPARHRNGCCLWWRTRDGAPCPGCPLNRDGERSCVIR